MTLDELQKRVEEAGLDVYLVSYGNCFTGQDVLPEEHKLKHICGFSGSAGALAITKDAAYLFVDGRYELQARKEVDVGRITVVDAVPRLKNVCDLLREKGLLKVGYDAWCYTVAEMRYVKRKYVDLVFENVGCWVDIDHREKVQLMQREERFAGKDVSEKCQYVGSFIGKENADYFLVTSADSVSWLLNLYARDLPYSPVVRAYALVSQKGDVVLFGNVETEAFTVQTMEKLAEYLSGLGEVKILYDAHSMPEAVKKFAGEAVIWKEYADIPRCEKMIKNVTELQGMINCHIRDGVALVKLLVWLEENWKGKRELDVVCKLHELRAQQQYFFSESFGTIAAAAENGAIVHYQPTAQSNRVLQENSLLLLDSGAQYLDGTTDVTRTVVLGEPSEEMKRHFTTVLKAHIALAQARFPVGTSGDKLDILAREPMWQYGLDYKHGTGHGVACFGNVHEGPVSISASGSEQGFMERMVTSIEPGYYRENAYGIRIENLVYTSKVENLSAAVDFLEFRWLTKVPIDKRLVDKYLLSTGEQDWLNAYHRDVYESLAAYVNECEKKWLERSCSPL